MPRKVLRRFTLAVLGVAVAASAREIRDTRVLDLYVADLEFSLRDVKRIHATVLRGAPDPLTFKRLRVRDLVREPRETFHRIAFRHAILKTLGQYGLTLGMSRAEVALYERQPGNPLFDSVDELLGLSGTEVTRSVQNPGPEGADANFIILDLLKAQRFGLVRGLRHLRPLQRISVAQSVNRILGRDDDVLNLERYLDDRALLKRLQERGLRTIVDFLNLSLWDFFDSGMFDGFELAKLRALRYEFDELVGPSCEDMLLREWILSDSGMN